jgi:hypothetical protein
LTVEVDVEIEIKRDAGFQSPIDIFFPESFNAFTIPGTSNRGHGHLSVDCLRLSEPPPTVRVWVTYGENVARVDDSTVAKTSVDIRGTSRISGSGSNGPTVGWNAPHPLEISCFLTSPIN